MHRKKIQTKEKIICNYQHSRMECAKKKRKCKSYVGYDIHADLKNIYTHISTN